MLSAQNLTVLATDVLSGRKDADPNEPLFSPARVRAACASADGRFRRPMSEAEAATFNQNIDFPVVRKMVPLQTTYVGTQVTVTACSCGL